MTKKNSVSDAEDERPYHHGDLRRALVQAGLEIVTETQDWAFSLRNVARRAGVSHNAPYNHFADKSELLGAVAAAGLETLRESMLAAGAGVEDPAAQLLAGGRAYVRVGVKNPALYRLVFGQALGDAGNRTALTEGASVRTRAVLEGIIERGVRAGSFAITPDNRRGFAIATFTAWSAVHGLTMLIIDRIGDLPAPVDVLIEGVTKTVLDGLRPR
jgi:AcrR family transcriptional regulator